MPNFIYAFHGGKKPENEQEGAELMAKWQAWIGGLGTAAVNPGNPVGMSKTVSASGVADNGGANPLAGFTIVKADTIDTAIALTKGCPILDNDGTIEVAEVIEM